MKAKIEKILQETFHPVYLQVVDESHQHADHNIHAKKGGTHFQLVIVSKAFEGKTPLQRHRMVYEALQEPLNNGVHALAIKAQAA